MRPQCCDCRFWQKHDSAPDAGFCHINPPVADDKQGRIYPLTLAADWCGMFITKAIVPTTIPSVPMPIRPPDIGESMLQRDYDGAVEAINNLNREFARAVIIEGNF